MKKNKFNIILFFIWLLIVIFTAYSHEIWRDEAQVWCIARDCGFIEMLNMARIEGHPVLWYIIIFPFAKLGFSVHIMQFIAITINAIAVWILLVKSNFSYFQKIITVFSAGLLYYIPIIARNYALIPLLLFLISVYWSKRQEHPYIYTVLLILLSQTHSYMLGLSGILALMFLFENKKPFSYSVILIVNFIGLILWYGSAIGINYALQTISRTQMSFPVLTVFLSKVYYFDIINIVKPLINYASIISVICFVPFILICLFGFFKENKKVFIIVFSGISYMLIAFSSVYFNGILYQKLYLIICVLIFGLLLLGEKRNKFISYSLNALLIISCITSFIVIKKEIKYNFSGGKQTAEYIKQKYPEEKELVAFGNPYLFSSVSAYLPDKKIYSPIANDYISFYTYNPKIKSVEYPDNAKIYITDEVTEPQKLGLKTIFENDTTNLSSKTEREVFKICIEADLEN